MIPSSGASELSRKIRCAFTGLGAKSDPQALVGSFSNVDGLDVLSVDPEALCSESNTQYDILVILPDANPEPILKFLKRADDAVAPLCVLVEPSESMRAAFEPFDFVEEPYVGQLNLRAIQAWVREAHLRPRESLEIRVGAALLESVSDVDPTTGLVSGKVAFREVRRRRRQSDPPGVVSKPTWFAVVLDIDDLTFINRKHGHTIGDLVLAEIAQRLKVAAGGAELVSRVGGDEFAVFFSALDKETAWAFSERLRREVGRTRLQFGSAEVQVTASFGLVTLDDRIRNIDDVLALAGRAVGQAKVKGKNRTVAARGRKISATTREESEALAVQALQSGDHVLPFAQPIVDTMTGELRGYELLSRLDVAGFESPGAFYELARAHSLVLYTDRVCLEACLRGANLLGAECHINVLPSTLINLDEDTVEELLFLSGDPTQICLEVSEQEILGEPKHLARALDLMRAYGVRIAIDDVGCGKSYLESLIELYPDIIKLDRRIVRRAARSARHAENLNRFVRVAETLGARVVAEGIEEEIERQVVQRAGVPLSQGFYWSRPKAIEDFL